MSLDPSELGELDLDELIGAIDTGVDDEVPEQALRAVRAAHPQIVPRLIELLRRRTDDARLGTFSERRGHIFAFYLLTEFRTQEALPAIVDALSVPGDDVQDLLGHCIDEDVGRVLAALAADRLDLIDRLIADRQITRNVRWDAARTYLGRP